ncbi:uncharacterized protein EAF01_001147 [Botrytis porri]|uniref:Uncharacterized protein n=1 Tax=Botrytis porri TaxID=87229 RepID=A0A4Z1KQT4_9HELO|nr:uncharacterized protein EAF01_001147 [Botrytis porri]KAF7912126.1 hypothetical protein EAF01_001147 [Botrytis porri]TGO83945.1 hypothetical protein BPOR_0571g00090 [Botrytis porri]
MNATNSPAQNISSSSSYSNSTDVLKYERKFPAWGIGPLCGFVGIYISCLFWCVGWEAYRTRPSSYGTNQGDEENGGGAEGIEG